MEIKARLGDARQQLDQEFLILCANIDLQIRSQNRAAAFNILRDDITLTFREAVENFINAIDQLRAGDHRIMKLTRKRRALRIGKMRLLPK